MLGFVTFLVFLGHVPSLFPLWVFSRVRMPHWHSLFFEQVKLFLFTPDLTSLTLSSRPAVTTRQEKGPASNAMPAMPIATQEPLRAC
jgi:hypothetical protein